MNIYNILYASHEENSKDSDADAINYARSTLFSEYLIINETVGIYRYVESVGGVDVYYDIAANHYFFSPVKKVGS